MSKRGFSSNGVTNTSATYYYFNAVNTKGNNVISGSATYGNLTNINSNMYWYCTGSGSTGSNVRPYVIQTDYAGEIISYKLWNLANYAIKGVCYDSSGNQHVLFSFVSSTTIAFRLLKFDTSNNLVLSKSFTFSGGSGTSYATFGMVIDSSDNLYVGTIYATNIAVTKIDCASYTVQWCSAGLSMITAGNQIQSTFKIFIDSSNNIYVSGRYYGGTPVADYVGILSLTSAGAWRWDHSYKGGGFVDSCIDSSGNLYNRFGSAILKHTSAGVLSWSKTVTGNYITINSLGNVVTTSIGGSSYTIQTISDAGAGISSTTWTVSTGTINPINTASSTTNLYVLAILNNGSTGAETFCTLKSAPNGTSLAGPNSIVFSQTLDNSTTNNWSTTLTTTTNSAPSPSDVSFTVSSVGSVNSLTVTVANITQALGSTVPTMYTKQLI
jgi:hypothetical protein